ncbi:MAG: Glu-tRNA(Gln) amidotransferase subunit GatD [Thermoplasmatota archaeon]
MYTNTPGELLERYGFAPGDLVRLQVSFPSQPHTGKEHRSSLVCLILEKGSRSRDENLIVKLSNGYNLSLDARCIEGVDLIERSADRQGPEGLQGTSGQGVKIVLVGTGGTIASMVDYRTGGVHPAMTPKELYDAVPDIPGICDLELVVASSILSEDVTVEHWDEYTRYVQEAFSSGAKGVVIAHGTDTLASTSAALSFTLQAPPGPIVLTGSQRSSDRPSSDSRLNLKHSLILASSDVPGGVYVLMHASINDGPSLIHLGTRVRKMHSTRRDAFVSIDRLPVGAVIDDSLKVLDLPGKAEGEFEARPGFNDRVLLISSQTGDLGPVLETVAKEYSGLVIAGSGMGHIHSRYLDRIRDLTGRGIPVVMTTDCISGSTDLDVYATGRDLLDAGVIPAGDMLPHVAQIKTMWVLNALKDVRPSRMIPGFRELFLGNMAGEISDRRVIGSFGQEYLKTLRDLGVE